MTAPVVDAAVTFAVEPKKPTEMALIAAARKAKKEHDRCAAATAKCKADLSRHLAEEAKAQEEWNKAKKALLDAVEGAA